MMGIGKSGDAHGNVASRKVSLKAGMGLSAAAWLLVGSGAAAAADECGAPVDGIVICTPEGNPYPDGIYYETAGDLTLEVADGVATQRVRVDGNGDASLAIDIAPGATISTNGFLRSAVEANADGAGSVTIDARAPIVAEGFLASGIRATADDGAISITSGDIDTKGGFGISAGGNGPLLINATGHIRAEDGENTAVAGIGIVTDGRVEIVNSGLIEQVGSPEEMDQVYLFNGGIQVQTDFLPPTGNNRDIVISGEGSVVANGFGAEGIDARGAGTIIIRQASVTSKGDLAVAIGASAAGDIAVDVDNVVSERSLGILALSRGGDVTIDVDNLTAFGLAAYGQSDTGAVTINAGDIKVGPAVNGVNGAGIQILAATSGDAILSGTITGDESFGIVIDSGGDASVAIAEAGAIDADFDGVRILAGGAVAISNRGTITATGADAIEVTSGAQGTVIDNEGRISGGAGYALNLFGGPALVTNSGTMGGAVLMTDGDDLLVNSGRFVATKDSGFFRGTDRLVNSGSLIVRTPGGPGVVRFLGLERFVNSGAIILADGQAGDQLRLAGDYVGAGGTLALDIGANGADRLIVGGAATGRTRIAANGLQGLLDPGRVIVRAGGGSSADAFTTGGLVVGFVEYGISFDAADTSYSLVGMAGEAAYRPVKYAEGARKLWYQSSDAWSINMRDMRDEASGPGRLWSQSYGSIDSHDEQRGDTMFGLATDTDLSTRQDYFGRQIGYDLLRPEGGGWVAGATAGYIDSTLDFSGARARAEYDALNGGLYAAYSGGPFFANLLAKYDHYWIAARDDSIGFEDKIGGSAVGVTAELGFRAASKRMFVEPTASLSYVRTDIDRFSALASAFEYDSDDGLRGRIGLRAGSIADPQARTRIAYYLGGHLVKEFGGRDELNFRNNGQSIAIEGGRIGLYGEGLVGVNILSSGAVSGFFEGFGTFGDLKGGGGRAGMRVRF